MVGIQMVSARWARDGHGSRRTSVDISRGPSRSSAMLVIANTINAAATSRRWGGAAARRGRRQHGHAVVFDLLADAASLPAVSALCPLPKWLTAFARLYVAVFTIKCVARRRRGSWWRVAPTAWMVATVVVAV
jgi:hypothetical protein